MRRFSRSLFLSISLLAASGIAAEAGNSAQAKAGHAAQPCRVAYAAHMFVEGINNQGWIVGHWIDTAGKTHWFVMNPFMPMFSDVASHGASHFEGVRSNESGGLTVATDVGG